MVQSLTVLKDLHEIPLWWSQQLHRHPVAQTHLPPLLTPPLHPPPLLTPLQALIRLRLRDLPPPPHHPHWRCLRPPTLLPPQYLLHNSLLPAKLRQVILPPPLHPAAWPSQPRSVQMLPLFPIMPELVAVLRPWAILASRDLPRQVCLQKPTPTASPG